MIKYRIEVKDGYSPQIKNGFFGRWYNLHAFYSWEEVNICGSIKMYFKTEEEAMEIINRHKRQRDKEIKPKYINVH